MQDLMLNSKPLEKGQSCSPTKNEVQYMKPVFWIHIYLNTDLDPDPTF